MIKRVNQQEGIKSHNTYTLTIGLKIEVKMDRINEKNGQLHSQSGELLCPQLIERQSKKKSADIEDGNNGAHHSA